jgi:hypothetical protein
VLYLLHMNAELEQLLIRDLRYRMRQRTAMKFFLLVIVPAAAAVVAYLRVQ